MNNAIHSHPLNLNMCKISLPDMTKVHGRNRLPLWGCSAARELLQAARAVGKWSLV